MRRRRFNAWTFGLSAKPPNFQETVAGSIPARCCSPNASRFVVTFAIHCSPCVEAVGLSPEEIAQAEARADIDFGVKENNPPYRLLVGY